MFWRKTKKEVLAEERTPVPGEMWVFDDGSPWPTSGTVRILAFKDGWVRYNMRLYKDQRLPWESFKRVYTFYREEDK